jgi:CBS domain-containing membrane protein
MNASGMTDLRMRVRDFMSREVVTLDATEHLDVAEDIMRFGRIHHVPVLSGGRLVGILSQGDLFRAAASSMLALEREAQREWIANISVSDVMTATVTSVEPDAPLRRAAELMLIEKIGCLPVMEHGKLVGLISETDCLRLLVALLASREAGNDSASERG